jgi:putative membrane protein
MIEKIGLLWSSVLPFILLNDNGWHMMDDWGHMMDWWGIPAMGFWTLGIWAIFLIIAVIVYRDAQERNMNGLLWFVLIIIPWIGVIFIIIYLVIREDKNKKDTIHKGAEEILDERYAKGEITRKEYQNMKKDIKK